MAQICRQITGSGASCAGWVGLIVATATNDWVQTCDYTVATCVRMDELGSRGLWAECVISPALYHCVALNQVFSLPAYVQTSRALMICACLLGLPAMLLVLMSMPCVRLPNDTAIIKKRRARVGGVFIIIMAVCGIVSTVWFPIGAYKEEHLMSFGFSLYAGWVGSGLCLLGGIVIMFWNLTYMATPSRDNSFYYSRQGGAATLLDPPANHAKSERV
ncbi:claudin-11b [Melanotaenia boesemani]|uniref:claudin-11b n=1 Tax=Melanotaenia boesemani TaxID=1250792 RepID=UPI001C04844D|nr:claudin-11b [Melanotaenia boesemani]